MIVERNIAALMRQDCRTVQVRFDLAASEFDPLQTPRHPRAKAYTYVTDFTLHAGDIVVVEAAGELKLAWVLGVDDDVKLEPNSETQFKWVKARVDFTAYERSQAKNAEIERVVSEAYRANLRRGFANQILSAVGDADRERITKLLGA